MKPGPKTVMGVEVVPVVSWGNIMSMGFVLSTAMGIAWTISTAVADFRSLVTRIEVDARAAIVLVQANMAAETRRMDGRIDEVTRLVRQAQDSGRDASASQTQIETLRQTRLAEVAAENTKRYDALAASLAQIQASVGQLQVDVGAVRVQVGIGDPRKGPR